MIHINSSLTGYLHEAYASALSEWGQPVYLNRCGGWVLERQIPESSSVDAMGCYPLFLCQNWSALQMELENIKREWISLALVTDPFGDYSPDLLRNIFPDVMIPFKEHYVVDLSKPAKDVIIGHHQRNASKAFQCVKVEFCQNPLSLIDDWNFLYNALIERHYIRGITAFSRQSFASQMAVPGLVAFRAIAEGKTVGMLLWYCMGKKAYYHLGAYSQLGYELRASFALFSFAIEHFADMEIHWLNLGAGAGTEGKGDDGLSRFKKGWSTGTRLAYFCGRIFNLERYKRIVSRRSDLSNVSYFPLYRYGEF